MVACMYVETNCLHRHGKTYRTVTVRESFRVDGKVMHRTIANISDLPDHAIHAIQQALRLGHAPTPAQRPQATTESPCSMKRCGSPSSIGTKS